MWPCRPAPTRPSIPAKPQKVRGPGDRPCPSPNSWRKQCPPPSPAPCPPAPPRPLPPPLRPSRRRTPWTRPTPTLSAPSSPSSRRRRTRAHRAAAWCQSKSSWTPARRDRRVATQRNARFVARLIPSKRALRHSEHPQDAASCVVSENRFGRSIFIWSSMSVCVSVCLCVCVSECLSVWVSECLSVWVSECLSVWVSECLSVWVSECLSVWVSECLSV